MKTHDLFDPNGNEANKLMKRQGIFNGKGDALQMTFCLWRFDFALPLWQVGDDRSGASQIRDLKQRRGRRNR